MMKYFKGSFIISFVGLILAGYVGYYYGRTTEAIWAAIGITLVLSVLEVSLSFDNAIVNAIVLEKMTPEWQRRFLTWGILIAVFGMRLIFPVAIVSIIASIGPLEALSLALFKPDDYAKMMLSVQNQITAFGGSFLFMVALKYFFNHEKDEHWISWFERPLTKLGKLEAIEIVITLCFVIFLARLLQGDEVMSYLLSGLAGLITFLVVDAIGAYLESSEPGVQTDLHKASAGMFLYLEVLDASFSFDGVVGAFAITTNLLIIMIGLGVGAFFVRSLTIYFVEKKTLSKFLYLEHGAFYAISLLSIIMLLHPFLHVPEWFTGLSGGIIIVASFIASVQVSKEQSKKAKLI